MQMGIKNMIDERHFYLISPEHGDMYFTLWCNGSTTGFGPVS